MQTNTKRSFLVALGSAGLVPLAYGVPENAKGAAALGPAMRQPYFPNVPITTHEGKSVRFYDDLVKGKVVIINAMYTGCTGSCPTNTASLLNLQEALGTQVGKDIFIYSITLQPEIDDARALKAYAEKYGVRPGWTFLTGKKDDMELIWRKLGFYDSDPIADANLSNHAGIFRIGNDRLGRWMMVPAAMPTRQAVVCVQNII